MAGAENIIEVEHVDAGYPGAIVLEDVSFNVKRGEVFVMLGGSGCGKSTMMKHLAGLNPVLAGRLEIDGMEWNGRNRAALCRKIGVMFQGGALFGSMTCLENILLPLEEFSRLRSRERLARAHGLLEAVGLEDAAGKMPSEISGGMKKRVAIARAMALDPEVVFLDEPGAGLDPVTSSELDDLVLRLRKERGTTFVVVSHELPSIFKIADRCVMFDRARRAMVAEGAPAVLRDSSPDVFVRRFFNRGKADGR